MPRDIAGRIASLEAQGRRCDGNSGCCTRGAVRVITVIPADGNGNPKPGATAIEKRACKWHRRQIENSGMYHLVSSVSLWDVLNASEQATEPDAPSQRGTTDIRFVA